MLKTKINTETVTEEVDKDDDPFVSSIHKCPPDILKGIKEAAAEAKHNASPRGSETVGGSGTRKTSSMIFQDFQIQVLVKHQFSSKAIQLHSHGAFESFLSTISGDNFLLPAFSFNPLEINYQTNALYIKDSALVFSTMSSFEPLFPLNSDELQTDSPDTIPNAIYVQHIGGGVVQLTLVYAERPDYGRAA